MYNKRHFEDLARVLKHLGVKLYHDATPEERPAVAATFAAIVVGLESHFKRTVPQFNANKWIKAAVSECIVKCD